MVKGLNKPFNIILLFWQVNHRSINNQVSIICGYILPDPIRYRKHTKDFSNQPK